jgi:hypothetical protein
MKNQQLVITSLAIAAALLLLAGAGASAFQHQRRNPYVDTRLSGPVTLKAQEWLELTPAQPLKAVRGWQEVTLFPDPPIRMVFDPPGSATLVPSDGREAEIEAELLGSNGVTHRSRPGRSERMTGDLKVTTRSLVFKDLPKDVTYTKVRIRSSVEYPVRRVLWRCYNWAEVHH